MESIDFLLFYPATPNFGVNGGCATCNSCDLCTVQVDSSTLPQRMIWTGRSIQQETHILLGPNLRNTRTAVQTRAHGTAANGVVRRESFGFGLAWVGILGDGYSVIIGDARFSAYAYWPDFRTMGPTRFFIIL